MTTIPRNALIDLLQAALEAIQAQPEDAEIDFSNRAHYFLRDWIAMHPEPKVAAYLFDALIPNDTGEEGSL